MKKVALFIPSFGGGGAERVFIRIANHLSARNISVDLLVAHNSGELQKLPAKNVSIIDLQATRTIYAIPAFLRYLRSRKPDAVLSCTSIPNIIVCYAKLIGAIPNKAIISERAVLSLAVANLNLFHGWLISLAVLFFYRFSDHIIAVSDDVKSDLVKSYDIKPDSVSVILNPVFDKRKKVLSWCPREFRGRKYIVSVGRLNTQKDHISTIHAFREFCFELDVNLVILGEGVEKKRIQNLVLKLGLSDRVFLLGFRKRPDLWIARASLFTSASRFEGLPSAVIEAVQIGLPIVVKDCPGGINEIFSNGLYARVVPLSQQEIFVDAMRQVLTISLAGFFVMEGSRLDFLEDKFGIDSQINKYKDLLISPVRKI
jgi:glycosyltransferase involved in cell wall biosynthesis